MNRTHPTLAAFLIGGFLLLLGIGSATIASPARSAETIEPAAAEAPEQAKLDIGPFDPNLWPGVMSTQQREAFLSHLAEPNTRLAAGEGFWKTPYHPQVTEHTFRVLGYPYYPGGEAYVWPGDVFAKALAAAGQEPLVSEPNTPADSQDQARELMLASQRCCELVYEWRRVNESPATALEVVRAIELTRRETGMYRFRPETAVQIKRTLGTIGRVNQRFDQASRLLLVHVAAGKTDEVLLARLEKELADLQALLTDLASQDDSLTVAMGLGPIDRNKPAPRRIDYVGIGVDLASATNEPH